MKNATYFAPELIRQFSALFLQYVHRDPALRPFIQDWCTEPAWGNAIDTKQSVFSNEVRTTLQQVIEKQYVTGNCPLPQTAALLAQPTTFTVTTGHQLNIFTGPLYFHYKIITVINTARRLKAIFPHYNFVPIYWMASEDHDVDEISHFKLFGKKYSWQSNEKGAVGRFNPQSLIEVARQAPEMHHIFLEAYGNSSTLSEATRKIVHYFYGKDGLLVIDGDDATLKRLFLPAFRREIREQVAFQAVQQTTARLAALGHKAQVTPREINLFYLDHQLRERITIDHQNGERLFRVLNTPIVFNEAEILEFAEQYPEKLSPNVILRPLYQETILPNLSYTGGPGELAYWLQLKALFDAFQLPMPLLLPRNFALLLNKAHQNRLAKIGFTVADLFASEAENKQKIIMREQHYYTHIRQETEAIAQQFDLIMHKAAQADASLMKMVQAQKVLTQKKLLHIAGKIRKAQERKHEAAIRQWSWLREELFPSGGLQERAENFLTFLLNDMELLDKLKAVFDPFDHRFVVVEL
ncbi:MAG: bacillithiol biosynthesis cysteine-adding enzyme BshC [Cytophagales bacterium]|nr:bacillithiol biosynthesis cysteine-adding enzyme BshC [Bernardetiaceae bacterium]MDW8203697.1 bacillithiol biosynthesis cysteine-adding enzyme BshC [Cytophagales bacterium]